MTILRLIWSFFCVFVWPRRFVEQATRQSIQDELRVNKGPREKFPTGDVSVEYEEEVRVREHEDARKLRECIVKTFVRVGVLFLGAWVTSLLLPGVPGRIVHGLRLASAGLILWAVIGRPGWELQTWSGKTLPELVGHGWFKTTYSVGIYLLALSMLLSSEK